MGTQGEKCGLPIGNLTSQIFANIYLNELDQFIKQTLGVKYYFRYADDFAIVNYDLAYLKAILFFVSDYLRTTLGLTLHPNKVIIRKYSHGVDFLGYVIFPYHTTLRSKTKIRMLRKLGQKEVLLQNHELEADKFYQTVQSYLGMLDHCDGYELQNAIKNNFLFKSLK